METSNPHVVDADMGGTWEDTDFTLGDYGVLPQEPSYDPDTLFDFSAIVETPNAGFGSSPAKLNYAGDPASILQAQQSQSGSAASSASPESSSQDSASDSSSRRKRKTTSESPPAALFNTMANLDVNGGIKREDAMTDMNNFNGMKNYNAASSQSLPLNQDIATSNAAMNDHFDFGSAASSPTLFNTPNPRFTSVSQSVNPSLISQAGARQNAPMVSNGRHAQFYIPESRDQSPSSAQMLFNQDASPTALFSNSTPSSGNGDLFGAEPMWHRSGPNNAWNNDLSFNSPNALGMTPSPIMHGAATTFGAARAKTTSGRIALHIDPIPGKSRVETQINIKMTLDTLPTGVSRLHLPTHTIAKAKMLAKDVVPGPDTLELHTMLVCTSAMNQPHLRQRALDRAASNSEEVKRTDTVMNNSGDDQDQKDDDPNKPLNGGEVTICSNCINRERKRAARKKVKKEEEQAHWEKHEKERVIVFNTNEYKEWQPWQPSPPIKDSSGEDIKDVYTPPDGATQVQAPMRIACYCRHQGEREGFQPRVIFTIKDHAGRVVAQELSDSILITDDHKTHPLPASMPGQTVPYYSDDQGLGTTSYYGTDGFGGMQPTLPNFKTSYSTPDLQSMGLGASHHHFAPRTNFSSSNMTSQNTSATMTPRNLSRQASPTGHSGPNKKRKSSGSVHQKLPTGLTMTRVDTNQPMSASTIASTAPSSAVHSAATSPFLTNAGPFNMPGEQPFISMPTPLPSHSNFGTGPPTPNEGTGYFTPSRRSGSFENSAYQFYSAPTSAHASRAPSPVHGLRQQQSSAAYNRQQAYATLNSAYTAPTNTMPIRSTNPFVNGVVNQAPAVTPDLDHPPPPRIHKLIPAEGPTSGGIDVCLCGSGFYQGLKVMFGDKLATTTTFWGETTLVCLLPPGRPGPVEVTFRQQSPSRYPSPPVATPTVHFTYHENDQNGLFEAAIKCLCKKQFGTDNNYRGYATSVIRDPLGSWNASSGNAINGSRQHRSGMVDASSFEMLDTEEAVLRCLDLIDMDDSPYPPEFNTRLAGGATMLSLACASGFYRIAAGLLARGAMPDMRDRGGYTPLMMASMNGHSHIVRLLILKGADPTTRSLRGYTASDLTQSLEIFTILGRVQNHARSFSAGRPTIRGRPSSATSLKSLWDPSEVSDYSSEQDEIDGSAQHRIGGGEDGMPASQQVWTHSRRDSGLALPHGAHVVVPPSLPETSDLTSPAAAMLAWRDQLAAQIQYFQQNVNWHIPNFQLPVLPPLPNMPDYQNSPMVRRISSLVPHRMPSTSGPPANEASNTNTDSRFWDMFSGPAAAPPAYNEIFPEKGADSSDVKKQSHLQASAEALLDQKCTEVFDNTQSERQPSSSKDYKDHSEVITKSTEEQQAQLITTQSRQVKKIQSDLHLWMFWVPLLLIFVILTFQNLFPGFFTHVVNTTSSSRSRLTQRFAIRA
ncbi:hypothetical protein LTR04_006563 [Oleoguttula sp. CCFEE 6159]|nr:hypothetical protein LTR04_006563 [Oleoguttula sp. CCFEE 6159]